MMNNCPTCGAIADAHYPTCSRNALNASVVGAMAEPLAERVDRLEARIDALEARVSDLDDPCAPRSALAPAASEEEQAIAVTDDEMYEAFLQANKHWWSATGRDNEVAAVVAALRPLLNRAAPEARVVGACAIANGDVIYIGAPYKGTTQATIEGQANEHVKYRGGTAHLLWLGPQIAAEGGR